MVLEHSFPARLLAWRLFVYTILKTRDAISKLCLKGKILNTKIQQIMKLIAELSSDERLDLFDSLNEEYEAGLNVPPATPVSNGNKLNIEIKRGAIEHRYISLGRNNNFFPADVMGESDKAAAKTLRLLVHGYAHALETDILRDVGRFRTREWKQFYQDNHIKAGDFIVIERVHAYEYKVYPLRLS